MFLEKFMDALAGFAAIVVICGFFLSLCYGGILLYRAGIEKRRQLEKRAGLLEKVEEYQKQEDSELEALRKRRAELGRND